MKMKLLSLLVVIVLFSSCTTKYSRKKTTNSRTKTTKTIPAKKETPAKETTKITTTIGETQEESLEATSAVKVTPAVIRQYIETYKDIAMVEMQRYNIPASITLAQGILESGSGQGRLARVARNHFGIKCHLGWEGASVTHDDDEKGECFRKYSRAEDSFEDHSLFLVNRPRYAFLFELKSDDYKGWAHGLKKAGYATDPNYPNKLIFLIDRYGLHKYDLMVLGVISPEAASSGENSDALYVVQQGDTLYGIARKMNISVEKLLEINNLTGSNIHIGQVLRVK